MSSEQRCIFGSDKPSDVVALLAELRASHSAAQCGWHQKVSEVLMLLICGCFRAWGCNLLRTCCMDPQAAWAPAFHTWVFKVVDFSLYVIRWWSMCDHSQRVHNNFWHLVCFELYCHRIDWCIRSLPCCSMWKTLWSVRVVEGLLPGFLSEIGCAVLTGKG